MSAPDVTAIRRFVDLVNTGRPDEGLAWLLEVSHPDVEFRTAVGDAIDGRVQRGPEAVHRYFSDLFETFDELRYDDPEFRAVGGRVVMLARVVGRGHESGAAVELELGVVCEFDGGLIRRATTYTSHAEATVAAEARSA